jgi:hypothetical protein
MTAKNKYYRHAKISQAKFRQLLRLFALDLRATDAAQLCHLSVRSTNDIYQPRRADRAMFLQVPPVAAALQTGARRSAPYLQWH